MIASKAISHVRFCLAPLVLLGTLQGVASAAEGAATLAPYFTPAGRVPARPDGDGFIRRWLILEPINKPNRTNSVFTGSYVRKTLTAYPFPTQTAGVPRAGETVTVEGQTLTWHALDATAFDVKLFNFAQSLDKTKYGVIFHVATVVDSPRDMEVRIAVGSNSASMWWVNGVETAVLFNDRRMVMDDVVSRRITLKKGRNIIRGAVINGPGLSDYCVRFIDAAGHGVTDLAVTTL
ncbi:hypothetical protein M2337_001681 [Sphingobium sp. B2D3A]|uniref:acetylxylan esterase n=1 Tax=unclassified Sphingobium TaxID=2611147 RepID=UPI002224638A|nr:MULTISPECIES: acetylxylan esterase [unclassified Sphingobium]MCW2337448.1 hypothetical protein [Sphingobium sp. B2D3A]MCW2383906.1 hypothetical protein [Sphingobium sp. B2D3D]